MIAVIMRLLAPTRPTMSHAWLREHDRSASRVAYHGLPGAWKRWSAARNEALAEAARRDAHP